MKRILLFFAIVLGMTTMAYAEKDVPVSGVFAQSQQAQKVTRSMKGSEIIDYIRSNNFEGKTMTISFTWVPNAEHNGHEYVNLGLSVKWATCNVGASSPSSFGDYYAWGETVTKSNYYWDTYKWCRGNDHSMTKYCVDREYGSVDNRKVLLPSDDVASVKWGGKWRMPTQKEYEELKSKCKWTWTTINGVKGYKVVGPNGKSIFLPAAGCRGDADLLNFGSRGYYWSSSVGERYSGNVCYLEFTSSRLDLDTYMRYLGQSVRPVCP